MRSIAFYGKGGSGKTTVATSLSVLLAGDAQKVLLLGCDPKHDTSYALVERAKRVTLVEALQKSGVANVATSEFLMEGTRGIDCVEAGGPEPGVGCAGRGITLMFEVLAKNKLMNDKYDWIVYDVLGDVVCGGFAAPIRSGYAKEVCVVVSGEVLSLYAANNLCKALVRYESTGVRLAGIVPNLRGVVGEEALLRRFASLLGARVFPAIPRDASVHQAHVRSRTVVEDAPDSPAGRALIAVKDQLVASSWADAVTPTPLNDQDFEAFIQEEWSQRTLAGLAEGSAP